jgi:predicted Zn-dependent protease with MMP-like domain
MSSDDDGTEKPGYEVAWDLLEEGDLDSALTAVEAFLAESPDSAEGHYVLGHVAHSLDLPERAHAAFARSLELDPDWIDAALGLARTAFRLCRFDDAREILGPVIQAEPDDPDARYLEGLLLERAGDGRAAEGAFERASRLAPDVYPLPARMTEKAFRSRMEAALTELPELFRNALTNVAIVIAPVPAEEDLLTGRPPHDPELLGLFSGHSRTEASVDDPGSLPAVITLYQRNLERHARTPEDLDREIGITLYHEIAHYLGFEEDDMADLGLE